MRLFNIFGGSTNNEKKQAIMLPVMEDPTPSEETVKAESQPTSDLSENKPLTVSYATGWPIDIIYGYLHKNYEQKGFDDSMVNSNLTFRDMNMNIIKNKILMVFREINLNYDVMKHDYETRIETCKAAGLLTTVAEIEKTMTIIDTHKEEMRRLEEDFRNNSNEASVPLQSYDCGFLRGVATIALGNTHRNISFPQNINSCESKSGVA